MKSSTFSQTASPSSIFSPSPTAPRTRSCPPSSTPTACTPSAPPLETSRPGVLAVGDVRSGSIKRVASASGEGAAVVPLVHAWLG